jgi:hypothetical protein
MESQVQDYLKRLQDKRLPKPVHCHRCGQPGHMRWHGSYVRSLIALATTYSIPVRRLFCTLCRHTFALLPSFLIKFHRYAKEVIVTALHWLRTRTKEAVVEIMANHLMAGPERNLATVTLHLWRRKFKKTHRL